SVLFRGHFELSVGAGTQLSLSRPTIWRSRSLLISADKLQCPLLALSGDSIFRTHVPFGGKADMGRHVMSAYDPKRISERQRSTDPPSFLWRGYTRRPSTSAEF